MWTTACVQISLCDLEGHCFLSGPLCPSQHHRVLSSSSSLGLQAWVKSQASKMLSVSPLSENRGQEGLAEDGKGWPSRDMARVLSTYIPVIGDDYRVTRQDQTL
jgi:hypothetical protein